MTTSYSADVGSYSTVPSISKSEETSSIASYVSELLYKLSTFHSQVKRRKLFVALLNYDDHMIEDMGLTRYFIEEAAKLPLKNNAACIARVWTRQYK